MLLKLAGKTRVDKFYILLHNKSTVHYIGGIKVKQIKAILVDIDDCLLPFGESPTHECHLAFEQIGKYVEMANRGEFPLISFCSGREFNYVIPLAGLLHWPNSWSVVESGMFLYNPTRKHSKDNPLINPAYTAKYRDIFERTREQVLAMCQTLPLVPYRGKLVNIALELAEGTDLTIEECYKMIPENIRQLEEKGMISIRRSTIAIDISPATVDKASGVRFFSRYTGIPLDQILGIGDSGGDEPMLKIVDRVGCPGNAKKDCKELVKQKGGHVSPFKYAEGVLDIIRHFTGGP